MGKMILVLGGARSGKSRFAQSLVPREGNITFIATAQPSDEEMAARIAMHRKRRPPHWKTIESPKDVDEAIERAAAADGIIVDCMTLYISNLLLDEENVSNKEGYIMRAVEKVCEACRKSPVDVVLVSNEVGSGLVPDNKLGRTFRDIQGAANQALAESADEVHLLVAGLPQKLK